MESTAEPAGSPSKAARRVRTARPASSAEDIALLRRLLVGRRPTNRCLQLLLIGINPISRRIGIKRTGAGLPEHLGIVDAGRYSAVLGKGAGRVEQPTTRA